MPRTIWILVFGFFFVFLGYNPVQQFLLSIFKERGEEAVAEHALVLLYGTIGVAGMLLPMIAHRLGTLRSTMMLAGATYLAFVLAAATQRADALYVAAIVLGVGGTLLWANMSRAVVTYGSATAQGRTFAAVPIAASCGVGVGNKLFHGLWETIGDKTFFVFAGFVGIGVAIFALLPGVKFSSEIHEEKEGGKSASWLLAVGLLLVQAAGATWGGALNGGLMLFGLERYKEGWVSIIAVTPLVHCAAVMGGGWLTDRIGGMRTLIGSCIGFLGGVVALATLQGNLYAFGVSACVVAATQGGMSAAVTGSIRKLFDQRLQQLTCYGLSTAGALGIVAMFLVSRMPIEATFTLLIGAGVIGMSIAIVIAKVVRKP